MSIVPIVFIIWRNADIHKNKACFTFFCFAGMGKGADMFSFF